MVHAWLTTRPDKMRTQTLFTFLSAQIWNVGIVCLIAGHVQGDNTWSAWLPTTIVRGDNQTVFSLKGISNYKCSSGDFIDAQCRSMDLSDHVVSCNVTDSTSVYVIGNCDKNCTVELRFLCQSLGASSPDTADHPLKVNGGFIAMAAGLSVIVPLICVLVIQLRRSKREERERVAAAAAAAAEAGTTPTDDLPPSYEQLFGSTVNPVSDDDLHSSTDALNTSTDDVMHARSDSLAVLLEENEVRRPRAVSASAVMGDSGINVPVTSDGSYDNGGYAGTPLSTISGTSVLDLPLSARSSSAGSSSNSQDEVDGASTVSTELSETNSLQSSSSLAPSTSSSDVPPPSPPPPPYRSPATSRHANNTNSSGIHQMLRRFPGMHVSIQELFSSFLSPQDNENDTPPPSYEEALKILEAASQSILGGNSN